VAEVILALDLPGDAARRLLDRIPELRWVKVGPILFTREGPGLVRELRSRGLEVFLDLKWHDIPNTVAGAVEAARDLGVAMASVHTLGGREMLDAAVETGGAAIGLVGVTVLTSHSSESFALATGRAEVIVEAEVKRLTTLARDAALRGVVCSPHEATVVRDLLPSSAWIVVPGIRRASDVRGDQVRTASPRQAVMSGATHLVVGRPILEAADPGAAFKEMTRPQP